MTDRMPLVLPQHAEHLNHSNVSHDLVAETPHVSASLGKAQTPDNF